MSSSGKITEVDLSKMPRMGRRNAVVYPSRILNDGGAFSPMNLVNTVSDAISDIDPDGIIEQELRLERRRKGLHEQKSKETPSVTPVTSVLDGWKKLHDASKKNKQNNGFDRLFGAEGSFNASLLGTEAKAKHLADLMEKEEQNATGKSLGVHQHPVIPWRRQDVKQTTMAEERRKLFDSFNKTSMEPPETPQVSDLTLQKMAKKSKRRKNTQESKSPISVPSTLQNNKMKESNKVPYSNITPKVITRWGDVLAASQQDPKLKNEQALESTEKDGKVKRGVGEKLVATRTKTKSSEKPSAFLSVKRQLSNTDNHTKLVNNYPASETVKNTTDQLPLTIGPRFNHKKALGLGYNVSSPIKSSRTEDDDNDSTGPGHGRLFDILPTFPKPKYEKHNLVKPPMAGNALKSTFLNLQRLNNGGTIGGTVVKKRASSTAPLVVGQLSANILGTPTIGLDRKPAPIITTIQPPPLPFLAAVQSQVSELTAIVKGSGTLKGSKGKKDVKSTKSQPQKTNNLNKMKNKPAPEPVKDTPLPITAKVVPALGATPNRYNNIYIGPYSGSESEGEHQGLKRKR